jgi:uncharacterized protein (DUF1800 family)
MPASCRRAVGVAIGKACRPPGRFGACGEAGQPSWVRRVHLPQAAAAHRVRRDKREGDAMRLRRLRLLLCLVPAMGACAQAHDLIFSGGFEAVQDAPASDAEAARFLTMATFGPTAADIEHLRAVGYAQWIEQQLSLPTTLERPTVEALDGVPQTPRPGQRDRLDAWLKASLTAPDQLRQRMAWALSQIFVATFAQSHLNSDPVALAEYYDILARDSAGWYDNTGYHAGTYPNLLYDVTRSTAMGKMLTYLRNEKPDPLLGTLPDENYAREVMQLFSIGLVLRNPDFSPVYPPGCDAQTPGCELIPTYPQATVGAYAKLFTGWSYQGGYKSNPTRSKWTTADYLPLICYDEHHDEDDAKTLLSYTGNYGAGSDAFVLPAGNGCENDLEQGLSIIAHHPNVAPFISRQLIERFASSNPSPGYIARVSAVFDDNGTGEYGDLGAVLKAILLDPEAGYDAAPPPAPYVFGKPREPLLKLTALYRYYHAAAADGSYSMSPKRFEAYQELPLGAPSVFNFYLPDYQPPGELATAGLYGPEYQIMNASSLFSAANDLRGAAQAWLGNPHNKPSTLALDLSGLDAKAADPGALVDQLDHDLLYGGMSAAMRTTLVGMVSVLPDDPHARVTAALQLLLASPEFAIQK